MGAQGTRVVRTSLVGLLLAVGAVGLQAQVPVPALHRAALPGPTVGSGSVPLWPVVVTLLGLLGLPTWWVVRRAKRGKSRELEVVVEQEGPRINPAVGVLLVLVVLSTLWLLPALLGHLNPPGSQRAGTGDANRALSPRPTPRLDAVQGSLGLPLWLLVASTGVALTLGVVLLRLQRSETDPPPLPNTNANFVVQDAAALTSARRAVQQGSSYRDRIIGAFAAMESTLAGEGIDRGASETPDELLSRIAGVHPGLQGDASRLVETFQYARFSSEPVNRHHLEVARGALDAFTRVVGPSSGEENR